MAAEAYAAGFAGVIWSQIDPLVEAAITRRILLHEKALFERGQIKPRQHVSTLRQRRLKDLPYPGAEGKTLLGGLSRGLALHLGAQPDLDLLGMHRLSATFAHRGRLPFRAVKTCHDKLGASPVCSTR